MSFDAPPLSSKDVDVAIMPALDDNYMYMIVDKSTKQAAVVDPVSPSTVFAEADKRGVTITAVLTTHNHWDHAGGNEEIAAKIPGIVIYGGKGDDAAAVTKEVGHDDTFKVGELAFRVLYTPCHTPGHVCYVAESTTDSPPMVFTGDTMFVAGCGNFNQGTPEMMTAGFEELGKLPGETLVFVGHEYTQSNLEYAVFADPDNSIVAAKLEWCKAKRASGEYTVPSTMKQEHDTNPFLRAVTMQPSIVVHCGDCSVPAAAMKFCREEKSSGIHKKRCC